LTYRWFNRWSELLAAKKFTCKLLKTLVADAVTVEPVSTAGFPANREINREFCKLVAFGAAETPNRAVIAGLLMQIPYSMNRELF
jgi:hypothetical protein